MVKPVASSSQPQAPRPAGGPGAPVDEPMAPSLGADVLTQSGKPQPAPPVAPVKAAHLGEMEDLAQMVAVILGTPLLTAVGAGIGFLMGGPPGMALGMWAGALPGTILGAQDLVSNVLDYNKDNGSSWYQAKFGARLLAFGPGSLALGAGLGSLVAPPVGTLVGALVATLATPVLVNLIGKRKQPPQPPAPTP